MKKNFLVVMVAASALVLATSCSSDALEPTAKGNEALVTFSVSANTAVSTRAISDGSGTNTLVYRVFDKDGKAIANLTKTTETATDLATGHNVTLTLAKGQTYKVAFWAQNSNCTAYTVDDNMGVSVSYDGTNNDETRDAFFSTVEITVKGDAAETVTLKRPFAQINVANTDADKAAAEASGIVVTESSVTVKNAATKLNVIDGTVSGEADVTYTAAAIPTEKFKADMDGDGTKEDYNYLSMCYVLPNDATTGSAKTVAEAEFTFKPATGENIVVSEGLQNIPIQRNYRTNIAGNILSANHTFTVKIDSDYDDDNNITRVSNSSQLAEAAKQNGAKIQLVASDDAYTLPSTVGNNVTITGAGTDNTKIEASTAIAYHGKDITLENLTYANASTNYVGLQHTESVSYKNCVITGRPTMYAKTATFDNCTFKQSTYDYCIWTYGSENITFNNCTFDTQGKAVKIYTESKDLTQVATFNNCTFKASNIPTDKGKAAIEVDAKLLTNGKYTININKCTTDEMVEGEVSKNKTWNVDAGSYNTTIYVDGTQVYPTK